MIGGQRLVAGELDCGQLAFPRVLADGPVQRGFQRAKLCDQIRELRRRRVSGDLLSLLGVDANELPELGEAVDGDAAIAV